MKKRGILLIAIGIIMSICVSVGMTTLTASADEPTIKYKMGDANLDGSVNTRDVVLIKQSIVGIAELTDEQKIYADTYADGIVNTRDVVLIQQHIVGMDVGLTKKFSIVWKNYDGTVLKTDRVETDDEPVYNGETPIKNSDSLYNYEFDGWFPEIKIATENAEYTARFKTVESTSYSIKYDANGGTNAPSSQIKTKGSSITLSNTVPTNGDQVFVGWQCAYDGNTYNKGATFNVDANVTLYAVWGHSCEACNGKGNTTCQICKGEGKIRSGTACSTCKGSGQELMVLCASCHKVRFLPGTWKNLAAIGNCPSCGYNQYIWGGTNLYDSLDTCRTCGGSGGYTYSTCSNCRGNGTLTCTICNGAKYINDTVRSDTVTLKNGNDIFASQSVSYGLPYKVSVPTKTGYTFIGWFDSADGGNQYTDSCGVSLNIWSETNGKTLYARWTTNRYTITFNSDCDEYFEPIIQDYNTFVILPTNLTKEGKSFVGWFDATFTTEYTFTAMPAENLTLYAKWVEYAVVLTCDESPAISVKDDINAPATYHATAVDTDGNPAIVTVQLLEGTQEAGETVVVRIIAVGKNEVYTTKIISDIKVYGTPLLDYVVEKDYFNLSEDLTADYFFSTATDTFGENIPVSVSVKENEYQAGDIVTLIISATDKAGNEINAEVKNIKAYGTPVVTRNTDKNDMKVTDIISNDLFGVFAVDSFGEELTVTTELESGTVSDGNTVIVKSSATDSKGNVGYISYSIKVYGLPKIYNASKTGFKVEDEITLSALGIIAKDSFNNVLDNITLELTDGEQIVGTTLTYLVTATDHLGNVQTRFFDNIRIYGTPSIAFDTEKTAMKVTDTVNAALLSATAKDSHNGNLTVSVMIENGTVAGGNVVTFRLTTTDSLGNEYSTVSQGIKVYSASDINLTYNSAVRIKKVSKGEEFGASATDSFGELCDISVQAAAGYTLAGGNTINLYIVATDNAGNTAKSEEILSVNVYDTPTLAYAKDLPFIHINESPYSLFSLKDSFGNELLFDVEVVSGSLTVGDNIVYKITGNDRLGNPFNEQYEFAVIEENEAMYRVEYYLENLEDDSFTLDKTETYVGVIDSAVTVTKTYEHFNILESTSSGNISDNGTVLKVYYKLERFTVNISATGNGYIIKLNKTFNEQFKYGSIIPAITASYDNKYLGFEWGGWYSDNEFMTEDFTIPSFTVCGNINYVATYVAKEEMKNFNFTSNYTTCTITGIKDKTVTEIIVPDYVTAINQGVFSGCSLLKSITIPFAGGNKSSTVASDSTLFGYIFGTSEFTGGTLTKQYYSGSSYTTYYIPSTLKSVTVTGSNILYGAFYNCSGLTSVTIDNGVTSIGNYAFCYCSNITMFVVSNSVTSIGVGALNGCSKLENLTIPFVGKSNSATAYEAVLGYIFGYETKHQTPSDYSDREKWSSSTKFVNNRVYNVSGAMWQYSCYNWYSAGYYYLQSYFYYIPTSLKNVIVTGTKISAYAFYNCSSLTSITIGNSVTSIGEYAFYNCSSLTSITIGNSVTSIGEYAFYNCSGLTSVTIGNSVASIGEYAFYNCSSLTSITIGNSVTSIGEYAFYNCSGLTSVTIGNSVTSIGEYAFYNCSSLTSITIPESVTSIRNSSFSGCSGLTSINVDSNNGNYKSIDGNLYSKDETMLIQYAIGKTATEFTIPDSVTSIGRSAFYKCSSLTSITTPNSVTSIGDYAFLGCSGLTSITIPNSITSIGQSAFSGCSSLTSIIILGSLTSIGNYAFQGCSSLTSIIIPGSVTSIGSYAFSDCRSLTSITIPDSVTIIGMCAFADCTKLTSITIPNSVTSIGEVAFCGCSSLTSITIPDSVTSIGYRAFSGCSSLTSITIPNSVTSIGVQAFNGCSSLTSIGFKGIKAQWQAISKGTDWKYKVPSNCVVHCTDGDINI